MAKEKFSNEEKKEIANENPQGKEIKQLAEKFNVCETTIRKAKREGNLLNTIDNLEVSNRSKEIEIFILKSQLAQPIQTFKNSNWMKLNENLK